MFNLKGGKSTKRTFQVPLNEIKQNILSVLSKKTKGNSVTLKKHKLKSQSKIKKTRGKSVTSKKTRLYLKPHLISKKRKSSFSKFTTEVKNNTIIINKNKKPYFNIDKNIFLATNYINNIINNSKNTIKQNNIMIGGASKQYDIRTSKRFKNKPTIIEHYFNSIENNEKKKKFKVEYSTLELKKKKQEFKLQYDKISTSAKKKQTNFLEKFGLVDSIHDLMFFSGYNYFTFFLQILILYRDLKNYLNEEGVINIETLQNFEDTLLKFNETFDKYNMIISNKTLETLFLEIIQTVNTTIKEYINKSVVYIESNVIQDIYNNFYNSEENITKLIYIKNINLDNSEELKQHFDNTINIISKDGIFKSLEFNININNPKVYKQINAIKIYEECSTLLKQRKQYLNMRVSKRVSKGVSKRVSKGVSKRGVKGGAMINTVYDSPYNLHIVYDNTHDFHHLLENFNEIINPNNRYIPGDYNKAKEIFNLNSCSEPLYLHNLFYNVDKFTVDKTIYPINKIKFYDINDFTDASQNIFLNKLIHYDEGHLFSKHKLFEKITYALHKQNNAKGYHFKTVCKIWDASGGSSVSQILSEINLSSIILQTKNEDIHNFISLYCFNKYFSEQYPISIINSSIEKIPIILYNDNKLKLGYLVPNNNNNSILNSMFKTMDEDVLEKYYTKYSFNSTLYNIKVFNKNVDNIKGYIESLKLKYNTYGFVESNILANDLTFSVNILTDVIKFYITKFNIKNNVNKNEKLEYYGKNRGKGKANKKSVNNIINYIDSLIDEDNIISKIKLCYLFKHSGDTMQCYMSDIINSILYTEDQMAIGSCILNNTKIISCGKRQYKSDAIKDTVKTKQSLFDSIFKSSETEYIFSYNLEKWNFYEFMEYKYEKDVKGKTSKKIIINDLTINYSYYFKKPFIDVENQSNGNAFFNNDQDKITFMTDNNNLLFTKNTNNFYFIDEEVGEYFIQKYSLSLSIGENLWETNYDFFKENYMEIITLNERFKILKLLDLEFKIDTKTLNFKKTNSFSYIMFSFLQRVNFLSKINSKTNIDSEDPQEEMNITEYLQIINDRIVNNKSSFIKSVNIYLHKHKFSEIQKIIEIFKTQIEIISTFPEINDSTINFESIDVNKGIYISKHFIAKSSFKLKILEILSCLKGEDSKKKNTFNIFKTWFTTGSGKKTKTENIETLSKTKIIYPILFLIQNLINISNDAIKEIAPDIYSDVIYIKNMVVEFHKICHLLKLRHLLYV